ncbi:hypothetical protein MKEN_00446700 [Mycena kentingensis (nom. inval.)]|nr:hypothetical protein MKEN_00446700 [Mycena kentingensis (nom. inval.)]
MLTFISRLWSEQTPPPPGMRVVPCSPLDIPTIDMVLTTSWVVDARLDPRILEETLKVLVEKKFPRAGARLVRRNGIYEFHIPEKFTAEHPPVAFTSTHTPEPYETPARVAECGSIARLRDDAAKRAEPSTWPSLRVASILRAPTCPSGVQGFLQPDTPFVHVHAASFTDLTFVSVTSSHAMFDAIGVKTFVHAWTRLISGENIDDIEGMDWDAQPFASFAKEPAPEGWACQRGWFVLGLFSMISWVLQLILRTMRDPEDAGRLVCLPKVFLEDEKRKILDELKAEGSEEWVGSSDVLMAWWMKTLYAHRTDPTLIQIQTPVNLRDYEVFPTPSKTIGMPYIHNVLLYIPLAPFNLASLRDMSMRDVALHFRRAILAYNADLEAIKNDLRVVCGNPGATLFPSLPGAEFGIITNWRKAKLLEVDFSGAIEGDVKQQKASVVWVTGLNSSDKKLPMQGSGGIFFETDDAIWAGGIRGAKDWERIKEAGHIAFSC